MLPGWGRSGRHVRKDGTPERFYLSFWRCAGIGGINMGAHSLALLQRPNAWTLHVVRGHCVTMDGSEVFSQVSGSEFLRSYHVLATSPLVFLELSSRVPRHTVAI